MQEKQKNQFDKLAIDMFRSGKMSRAEHVMPKLEENLNWIKNNKSDDQNSLHFIYNEENLIKRIEELRLLGADMQHLALKTSYMNYPLVTDYLIKHNVDFNVFNRMGGRLIYTVSRNNIRTVLKLLIKNNKIDIYFKDPEANGQQVMHNLLRYGHVDEVKHILNIDPQLLYSKDNMGNSFLHFACLGIQTVKTSGKKIDLKNFILSKLESDFDFLYSHRSEIPKTLKEPLANLFIEINYKRMSSILPEKVDSQNNIKMKKI